jgi:hypothetical protein
MHSEADGVAAIGVLGARAPLARALSANSSKYSKWRLPSTAPMSRVAPGSIVGTIGALPSRTPPRRAHLRVHFDGGAHVG